MSVINMCTLLTEFFRYIWRSWFPH